VAQLDSASDYESEGYRFESCQGHNFKKQLTHFELVAFLITYTLFFRQVICNGNTTQKPTPLIIL
jgi:hypothetical protein